MTGSTSHITKSLLHWYDQNARSLPWRRTRDPYRILVSEVMLQQTQVHRVLLKYPKFLERFPNFQTLSKARTADVIRAWAGMGYNNRAVRLQRTAQRVMQMYAGRLPADPNLLQQLPGIGRYTAHAVACFSFRQHTAVVDTNIRRVLSRMFSENFQSKNPWELAELLLPKRKAYEWNQALMELGSTRCTAVNPKCHDCPLQRYCQSAFQIPQSKKSKKSKDRGSSTPKRIYRGRVVTVLRTLGQREFIDSYRLLTMIRSQDQERNMKWFLILLSELRRDGLIQMHLHKNKILVSLPQETV
jgi:A/G-specific adenine glycosylase